MTIENAPKTHAIEALLSKPKKAQKPVATQLEDPIIGTAHQIENMTEAEVIKHTHEMRDERGWNAYKLGGCLSLMMLNNWTSGYPTFRDFVEKGLGMRWRDAKEKIKVYDTIAELGVTSQQLDGLPWSKLVILAPILTADNCQELVAKAKELTLGELRALVETHQKANDDGKAKSDVVTWSVKLHPDQREVWAAALDKARAEANTKFDAVAMDAIAVGYLGGSVQLAKVDAKPWMESVGYETVLNIFVEVFPSIDLTVAVPDKSNPQGGEHGEDDHGE